MFPGEGSLWIRRFSDLPSPEKITEIFAGRAVRLIGGRPVDGGPYEIILAPSAANSLQWGLMGALNGNDNLLGATFLEGKLGQKIAFEGFSVYDDPLMPWAINSRPADDEGVASEKLALVENGVLKNFFYDSRTGAKANAKSTGAARREDYYSLPDISPSNFYIAPGTEKVDDVIAACRKGIIVEITQGWGLQGVNGQYSAGINGVLVQNGKRIRPVAGVTIGGTADDLLKGIGAVCDDITFFDRFNSPTLYVKKMVVGA